ncbi:HD domain-containing protein [Labrys wisconsinensis]|uniref:(P)ppGpp synthase/HD superfamily hydrolase n=1 Tax=Labrys wisconsinensis TaxID=425677 RepID=A0ABU0JN24_9HYPH|nr:HD domain-containing protein [Labrys wisconsinensis]MDQ0475050.1 (p)ppGpp synthase/HD superfamily hydrolase [Labrys wisconsinensis]
MQPVTGDMAAGGPLLTSRFDAAFAMASALHRTQLRKGPKPIAYLAHLMAVSALVIENGGSEDQAIAALLHDAAEDQGGEVTLARIEAAFGPAVAGIVADCTDAWVEPKPPWQARKQAYLERLPGKPAVSLLVSLADKVHNARAILEDRAEVGEAVWERFTGGKEGTIWYYRTLSDIFLQHMPGRLSRELARIVAAF